MTAKAAPLWWLQHGSEQYRCTSVNKAGERCRNKAVTPDPLCPLHIRKTGRYPTESARERYKRSDSLPPLESGLQFGKMRVLEHIGNNQYLCECQCGAKEKRARNNILSSVNQRRASACRKCVSKDRHATNPFRSPHALRRSEP